MVCESLVREGTDVMFGLPGGAILPLYQTLPEYPQLRHILVRHEQNAGHAADGYARASGKVGVAIATSGPGATNLVTPLATAMMDSVPMVAITGQVPRAAIGRDAFQETDTTGITLPITKHNYLVMDTADIPRIMSEAFHIARTGRPGPVLIDLPRDVLTESADFDYPEHVNLPSYKPTMEGHGQMIKRAAQLIQVSQRPLLLVGHGAIISGAFAEVREIAEKAQIPVITTLLGIGSFSGEHILSMGMPGMHGQAYNNWAIDRADLIIGVGMRFDDRVTGRLSAFAPNAKVIHIDIDPAEVGKNVGVTVPIVGDAKRVLHALVKQVEQVSRPEWIAELEALRSEHPLSSGKGNGLRPQQVVQELCAATDGRAIVVTGVGQHQMWAAQHYVFKEPGSWITSGGLGTMGFEVPAAMGAAFAQPNRPVWSIAGDGGFQMTMSELATIVEHNVPVK
ncbi:MAG: biosynthetic-type acetolactate synthase large subunit, partial [Chloroflexi bacterium]|nr:biosynthetic-type acetolactate synthase large subunit [Chloroflexota bacterium]